MLKEYFLNLSNKAQRQQDLKDVTRHTSKPHVLDMAGNIIPLENYDGGFYSARSQVEFYQDQVIATIYREEV